MKPTNISPFEGVITALEGQGKKIKRLNPREVMAQCPAHEDRNPSLHVTDGDGKALVYCHAGCPTRSILDALGLDDEDLFAEEGKKREEVAHYDYYDEAENLRFQVVRFYPKDFRQRRPIPGGQWTWNLHGVRPILYHLPEVLAADDIVYLTEGEKDADRLISEGVVATTAPMGAGKWHDHYAQSLIGKRVIIVADRDEQGYAHAERVKDSLDAAGITSKIVQAKEGKDISDHLDRGHSLEDLEPATGVPPTPTTRRLPGRHDDEAEIVIDNLHVRAMRPYRGRRGYATTIYPTVTVMGKARKVHWGVEVELVSATARETMARVIGRIDGIEKGQPAEWVEKLFAELMLWAEERRGLVQVAEHPVEEQAGSRFLIQPWWPSSGSTVIAGAPGSKKSYLALALAISVTAGQTLIHGHPDKPGWAKVTQQARVAYFDWEAEAERIVPRVRALMPGASLLYQHLNRPLADLASGLVEMIRDEGIEAVVIDSLSASIGRSLIEDEAANRFWDAVALLGVPTLVVAHKSAESIKARSRRVFGSIMHEARPRVIWNVETAYDSDYLLMECFKDSDYALRGTQTAWEVEFTTPGEFQAASRVYFNPIPPESVVFDDEDEEQQPRRGQPQMAEAEVRRYAVLIALQGGAELSAQNVVDLVFNQLGVSVDPRRARDDLKFLEQRHPEVVTRESPAEGGGRATIVYRWESAE